MKFSLFLLDVDLLSKKIFLVFFHIYAWIGINA